MTSPEAVGGKSLLADPGPFLGDEEDAVKRQKEYRSFVSLTYLKMEVDNHRFKSARHKIFYVASRIQGSAYTHIESFVFVKLTCQTEKLDHTIISFFRN